MIAAGVPTPNYLVGDFLAEKLGAEAVQTLKVRAPDGTIHRLIVVHAEVCKRLLMLFTNDITTTANLALKGLSMTLNIKFEGGQPCLAEATDAEVAASARRIAAEMAAKVEALDEANTKEVAAQEEPKGEPEVQTYSFNGMELRSVQLDGEPWFFAGDVCKLLTIASPTNAVRHLGSDEVQRVARATLYPMKGGTPLILISESGLYKVITRSDKPQAKPFQEWVTRDVLPSIRKTGSYSMTDGVEEQPTKETTPALVGEIIEPNRQQIIEATFTAMVRGRFEENIRRVQRLRKVKLLRSLRDGPAASKGDGRSTPAVFDVVYDLSL
ncbi:BRO family protein [Ruegeria sp. WL0004]|uniref:BRO family protein n=1 Tax=Ruegeria marisflavi TaxID=2984152 RepID=A0ABT2WVF3_9RHOB|nr:BRO family protein [Ruegeria sp. WL0004]MCU9839677.1 BRO family protein [Ruegeria sp. WL0004]